MAFNFNWSPLTADASFYGKAQELLTTALNKSPKPPIIVDDILVNELNLGHVPPELEILEIGDLAEDRFRGIFKMSYNGDAFLTLKTRVQANPLNTHLLTRPSFASPQPLAAATGLTIPLQITLSDIKLSGFIILVFSRQKGLTLVFRNDPLESLKVSSTFDSIPFVRNYLQKEIEGQLRVLLMDELPAIIHRLSLRLWGPEHQAKEEQTRRAEDSKEEPAVDPLASPPQDPVDAYGRRLNSSEIASLSIETGIETQNLFSQKNLLRLAALTDSQRTLSLFTPPIRDVVFRAWAGPSERGDFNGLRSPAFSPALSRSHSHTGGFQTTYTFDRPPLSARPTLSSMASHGHSYSLSGSRPSKGPGAKRRKKRVVNLRKPREDGSGMMSEEGSVVTDTASVTESTGSAPSIFSAPPALARNSPGQDTEPTTPPRSPFSTIRRGKQAQIPIETPDETPRVSRQGPRPVSLDGSASQGPIISGQNDASAVVPGSSRVDARLSIFPDPSQPQSTLFSKAGDNKEPTIGPLAVPSNNALPSFLQFVSDPANGGSIVEQAWMVKMAGEIARRYEEQKNKNDLVANDEAPPAYGS